jgi:hypothetical protein
MGPLMPRMKAAVKAELGGATNVHTHKQLSKWVSDAFLADCLTIYRKHGRACLEIMAHERPSDFIKVIAALVPFDETIDALNIRMIISGVPRAGEELLAIEHADGSKT